MKRYVGNMGSYIYLLCQQYSTLFVVAYLLTKSCLQVDRVNLAISLSVCLCLSFELMGVIGNMGHGIGIFLLPCFMLLCLQCSTRQVLHFVLY